MMEDDIEVASTTESQNDEEGGERYLRGQYMQFYTDSPPTTNDEEVSIPHEQGPVTGDQYAKTLPKNSRSFCKVLRRFSAFKVRFINIPSNSFDAIFTVSLMLEEKGKIMQAA